MPSPYEVLNLDPAASEEQIRKRYLELVREFPPERAPERFGEIRQAYDELRNPITRMRKRLTELSEGLAIDEIAADFQRRQLKDKRITAKTLLHLAENLKS
jgi:curved DNA-binding protein CbpA